MGAPPPPKNDEPQAAALDIPADASTYAGAEAHDASHEVRLAILNAVKLSLSLIATIAVAIIVRIFVPRYFKPAGFGQLSFAEAYAATFFSFATYGVDTYIRKEIATRPDHANEFYAGFFLLRLATSVVIFGLMAIGLQAMGKGALEWRLAFIFAIGQVAFIDNYTLSAFLQAASQVTELAWMNVVSKILWCAGIFVGLLNGATIEWVAICFFISETIKTVYLMVVAHRRLHLTWDINLRATWDVVKISVPFFLNNIALSIYAKINIILLSKMSTDEEVGWYSAAMTIAGFSLLFLPVLQAVIMPMAARTAKTSEDAMNEVMRGGARLMIVGGTLISLVLMLNAEFIAQRCFGAAYAPAAWSLQMIAPMFPLTYLACVGAMHLIQQERNWTLIKISLVAVILNPLLNAPLIAIGRSMGPGRAGGMSAIATVITELVTVIITLAILGKAAVNRQFWDVVVRTLTICALIIAMHMGLEYFGDWRLPLDVVAYAGLAMLFKTLPIDELRRIIAQARQGRAA